MNELLNDPDAFQDFFLDLDPIKSMRDVSQEVQQGNEQLARKTLAREEELRRLQSEVREKIKAANEAKQELDKKETERDAVLSVGFTWSGISRSR